MKKYFVNLIFIFIFCLLATSGFANMPLHVKRWQSMNGVNIWFVQRTQLPILDVRLVFNAGAGRDGMCPGLASLTAKMLSTGTKVFSWQQITDDFAITGARYNSTVDNDMANFSLRTLTKPEYLDTAVKTFASVVSQPSFTKQGFDYSRKQQLIAIEVAKQNPFYVANNILYQSLYANSGYATPVLGTAASVKSITLNQISNFYNEYYSAKNANLILVGDISLKQAKTIANSITKDLPIGAKAKDLTLNQGMYSGSQLIHESINNSGKTVILIGERGIWVKSKMYFPLLIANEIMGGSSLYYGIFPTVKNNDYMASALSSHLDFGLLPGPFFVQAETNKENSNLAVLNVKLELENCVKKGPTEEELDISKQGLYGRFLLSLTSNSNLANRLEWLAFYNLPPTYLQAYKAHLYNVSIAAVKSALQQVLSAKKLVTIVVGEK